MTNFTTVLSNINTLLPLDTLSKHSKALQTDKYCKSFTTNNLFLTLLTAQARQWASLRDIETGFAQYSNTLYHLGLRSVPHKSTVSDANCRIESTVFQNVFLDLVARTLQYSGNIPKSFKRVVKVIDSSIVELTLSLFDWARFRTTKGAIKIHAVYNLSCQIPEIVSITNGNVADVKSPLFKANLNYPDSIVIFDRGYHDFALYDMIDKQHGVFVTRLKKGIRYELIGQHKCFDKKIISDQTIRLISDVTYNKYSKDLRLIEYTSEDGKYYRFLTNDFRYSALTIANLYKKRWQIELFFKWIKQHLKIKTFFGTSRNAVMNQIWVALIYYTLIKYVMFQCNFKKGALELSRILRENLFNRGTIIDFLKADVRSNITQSTNSLYATNLFNTS